MGAIAEEQQFVDAAYGVLASHTSALEARMNSVRTAASTGTVQDELERQAQFDNLLQQWRAAQSAQTRLCFGRLDLRDAQSFHIGRIGLRDEDGEPILLDWRAPQSAGFYQATTVNPGDVARRRRIITRDRTVTHVEDDDLSDPTHTSTDGASAAMEAPREGRMGDIIATIAADQDAIIRSPLGQITVVEGGPGTGKTVVALHRAAWLLYTHRERLAKDGVLIIGPSTSFLHYIEQVLPSLGETDVVLLTPAQLMPGLTATAHDARQTAAVKGDLRMTRVLANLVRARQRVPRTDVRITMENGATVVVTARQLEDARRAVPRSATFHAGRDIFLLRVVDALARDRCRRISDDPDDPDHRQAAVEDLVVDRHVRRTLNLMWLPISPATLLNKALSDRSVLAPAAEGILGRHEIDALLRPANSPWTTDDVPLLDELAHLLGEYEPPRRVEPEADVSELHVWSGPSRPTTTLAERALADREWVYGHVVVDEAQELSAMAWHCIARRCTRRSMTIVGDLQQTTHPAGASDWDHALADIGGTMVRHTLTITYRITEQIARTAIDWLRRAGGSTPELRPIREGNETLVVKAAVNDLAALVTSMAAQAAGRACIVVPDAQLDAVSALLTSDSFGFADRALDAPIAVLPARETKGLEFDTVFVLNPDVMAEQGVRGSDVYVACTRATKQLVLVELA